jgi:hypothetical protein
MNEQERLNKDIKAVEEASQRLEGAKEEFLYLLSKAARNRGLKWD